MRTLFSFIVFALLGAGTAFAAPAQVVFIRHAEKPADGPELSAKGFKRAEALVKFFKTEPAVAKYGPPAGIYAAAPKHEDSSIRSIQTVTPLARAVKVPVNDSFTRGQTTRLVREIMENPVYDGGLVVVCWQHERLVDAALTLAEYNNSSVTIPQYWDDGVFDRAWVLNLSNGKVVAFKDLPQRLLPGDSAK